jgi:hypothetical protein
MPNHGSEPDVFLRKNELNPTKPLTLGAEAGARPNDNEDKACN